MNQGAKTIIYPVSDLAKAKAIFTKFLGIEPFADSAYYVGYMIGDQQIGLAPKDQQGATAYYHVDDIKQSLQILLDGGCQTLQGIHGVGGGRQIASVKDADGNVIGFLQDPK